MPAVRLELRVDVGTGSTKGGIPNPVGTTKPEDLLLVSVIVVAAYEVDG